MNVGTYPIGGKPPEGVKPQCDPRVLTTMDRAYRLDKGITQDHKAQVADAFYLIGLPVGASGDRVIRHGKKFQFMFHPDKLVRDDTAEDIVERSNKMIRRVNEAVAICLTVTQDYGNLSSPYHQWPDEEVSEWCRVKGFPELP